MVTQVVNVYKEPYDVYIGRKGKDQDGYFGNPFPLKDGEERGSTIERYREYFAKRIETDKEFKTKIESLRGKKLGCFCKPQACHGDIIKEYLDGIKKEGMKITEEGVAKTLDIESSGLLANMLDYSEFPYKLKKEAELWCISIRDVYTDTVVTLVGKDITKERLKKELKGCKYLIHHNGIKFDLIVLRLFGVLDYTIGYLDASDTLYGEPTTMVDTLIMSRLLSPDRFGGHSLKEWGLRTGYKKTDFRQVCIDKGYIEKNSPKGSEFKQFCPEMIPYCEDDTMVTKNTLLQLLNDTGEYKGWRQAIKMENKLADLAIRRESLGFWFDKDLAVKCVEDLTQKMEELQNKVNPILPPKPMTKGELSNFTPPNTQFLKNGKPSSHIIKFAERVKGFIEELVSEDEHINYVINFESKRYPLPHNLPLKTHVEADISNLDHVKMTLTDVYGWIPTEWAERDLTKDSKKQSISMDKRLKALERWYKETVEGKYKELRLGIACERFKVKNTEDLFEIIKSKLDSDFPVRVPTSPKVRVGVEKDLCPNLVKLGEKVDFAKDFSLFLTYKHRKSSIAGGEIEDMDFDLEAPNTGFLSMYREEDGRIPTPAIEIGAASNRYRHIGVANIARASSIYGKEMRSLFGCGEGYIQFGFDYSSLENRVQGGYVRKYEGGEELAEMLLAEKPNDLHSINAKKLDISRSDAKSFGYAILYGASVNKLSKMLGIPMEKAKELYDGFWEAVPALKQLKEKATAFWEATGKSYIQGIDGRKIFIRSPHSILNFLFQSGGVICAKYTTVFLMEELERLGYIIDPFLAQPSVCEMISYHDEAQLMVKNGLIKFEVFNTEEEAKEFHRNWNGTSQLSTVKKGTKWYIALPSDVSTSLEKATKKTEKLLKLQFELSFEYDVHKNWWGCH